MWDGEWAARLKRVERPRPAVPPVMKRILEWREGMVVGSKVVDMVGIEWGRLFVGGTG